RDLALAASDGLTAVAEDAIEVCLHPTDCEPQRTLHLNRRASHLASKLLSDVLGERSLSFRHILCAGGVASHCRLNYEDGAETRRHDLLPQPRITRPPPG